MRILRKRRDGYLWDLLRQLHQESTSLWLVIGDFNEILSSFEKKKGQLRSERQMCEFRRMLDDCGLNDLGFVSRGYTWERGCFLSTNIRERLHRGVANLDWLSAFPNYSIEHLSHSIFDHCSILMNKNGKFQGDKKLVAR